jgi:hypothetical protein
VLALVLATPAPAQAGRAQALFASARERAGQLDFRAAVRLARAALEAGDAAPDDVWQLHAFLGEKLAALGEDHAAVEAFGCALELHPELSLAPDASPRLRAPFRSARQRLGALRLSARIRSLADGQGAVKSTLSVEADPQALVSGARIYVSRGGRFAPQRLERGPSGFQAVWRCADPAGCHYYLALLDGYGNEAMQLGSAAAPLSVVPEAETTSSTGVGQGVTAPGDERRSALSRVPAPAWVLGSAGAAAIGGGIYLWLRGRGERADLYATCGATGQCSAQAVQSARSKLIAGDVAVGVGLTAVAAAIWWGIAGSHPSQTAVAGLPIPGGAVASCTVAF